MDQEQLKTVDAIIEKLFTDATLTTADVLREIKDRNLYEEATYYLCLNPDHVLFNPIIKEFADMKYNEGKYDTATIFYGWIKDTKSAYRACKQTDNWSTSLVLLKILNLPQEEYVRETIEIGQQVINQKELFQASLIFEELNLYDNIVTMYLDNQKFLNASDCARSNLSNEYAEQNVLPKVLEYLSKLETSIKKESSEFEQNFIRLQIIRKQRVMDIERKRETAALNHENQELNRKAEPKRLNLRELNPPFDKDKDYYLHEESTKECPVYGLEKHLEDGEPIEQVGTTTLKIQHYKLKDELVKTLHEDIGNPILEKLQNNLQVLDINCEETARNLEGEEELQIENDSEDVKIIEILYNKIKYVFSLGDTVSDIICVLMVYHGYDKRCQNLQENLLKLQTSILGSLSEIWPKDFAVNDDPEDLAMVSARYNIEKFKWEHLSAPKDLKTDWRMGFWDEFTP